MVALISFRGGCSRASPPSCLLPPSPDLQVVEDSNKELIMSLGIRAFPTFRFYIDGNQVDETRGANIQEVASKVRYKGSYY